MSYKNKELANDAYQQMNNRWRNLHLKTLYISTFTVCIVEITMFFVIHKLDTLSSSIDLYIWKYNIIPTGLCLICCLIGNYFANHSYISSYKKQYILSLLTVCITFIISIAHNIFVAALLALCIPPLLTILYEDEQLTSFITIICVICQFLSGFIITWDPDKVVGSLYIINLLIIFVTSFLVWIISCTMIRFIKMKRTMIIQNEIERYDLQRKIRLDDLTSIGNKMAFIQELQKRMKHDKESYLIMFDIDKFKGINDQYGHLFGDEVLNKIGHTLLDIMPKGTPFRYGGDEFCILLDLSYEQTHALIHELQRDLKNIKSSDFTPITISVGVTKYLSGMSQEEWIAKTDRAMYASKSAGGDTVTFQ